MPKKRVVQSYRPDPESPEVFPAVVPDDFTFIGKYAEAHNEITARDFLIKAAASPVVAGFGLVRVTGLQVQIIAPGHVIDLTGRSFDLIPASSVNLTFDSASTTLPRIDLIYARLEEDVPAVEVARSFARLRTQSEINANTPAPREQHLVPTEFHNRIVIGVRKGANAANPIAPGLQSNEVPLYNVRVNANATTLADANITDRRNTLLSLFQVATRLTELDEETTDALAALETLIGQQFLKLTGGTLTGKLRAIFGTASVGIAAAPPASVYGVRKSATVDDYQVQGVHGHAQSSFPNNVADGVAGFAVGNAPNALARGSSNVAATLGTGAQMLVIGSDNLAESLQDAPTATAVGVRAEARGAHSNYGLKARAAGISGRTRFNYAIIAEASGGINNLAAFLDGDVVITGTQNLARGEVKIDHPLDPDNKTLRHGVVQSARNATVYPGTAVLAGGTVTVNLDTYFGMTPGTFAALNQSAEVFTTNKTTWDKVRGNVSGGNLTITSENGASTATVAFTVIAERKDAVIAESESSGSFGGSDNRLIVEFEKELPTAEELEELEARLIKVRGKEELDDQVYDEIVPSLIGKKGYRLQPHIPNGPDEDLGVVPVRQITIETHEPED